MFTSGSLEDRLARAIYAEAPTLSAADVPVGYDLAVVVNAAEVSVARSQALAAAAVLAEYQEVWVHLMAARMGAPGVVEVPDMFPVPDAAEDGDEPEFRRAFADGVPDDYEPRHAGPTLATLHTGEWTEVV